MKGSTLKIAEKDCTANLAKFMYKKLGESARRLEMRMLFANNRKARNFNNIVMGETISFRRPSSYREV